MQVSDLLTAPDPDFERVYCRRSLRAFVRRAWHVVEPATELVWGYHIDAIIEHLEAVARGEIRNLLVNVPPRHGKSLLCSVFWPAWTWTHEPSVRWLYASYSGELATEHSVDCRRLIRSQWYQDRWGEDVKLAGDQDRKTFFQTEATGYRIATSVGGTGTGRGGDVLVADDPHDMGEVHQEPARESVIHWWGHVMSTRLNDPNTGARVIIMQRGHEDDLSGHVLAQGGYEHLCLPFRYEPERSCVTSLGWEDPRTEEDELLWSDRFETEEALQEYLREIPPDARAGQLQQRPTSREGGIIKRDWLRFHEFDVTEFDELIQSWDTTFKGEQESDYVVGLVWGVKGPDRYLMGRERARMNFTEACKAVVRLTARWPQAKRKLVEDKANGPAMIQTLRGEVSGMIAYNPGSRDKVQRAREASVDFEAGHVYVPNPKHYPWAAEYVEELVGFPNTKNDDQVDATTQALLYLSEQERVPEGVHL